MLSRRTFIAVTGGALAAPSISWAAAEVPAMLDHILLGCSDLDGGIEFVEKHTGVRAAFGGVHPGRGTRNALLSLGEKHYLEIIAPDPQQPGAPDHYGLLKLTEPRLVGWAAHPGNLNRFAIRLRDAGLAFDGPNPGSRKRPDGRLLQWKTLNLKDDLGGLLPFFIEWSTDTIHPSVDSPAGCKIVHFEYAGPDSDGVGRIFDLMGLEILAEVGEKSQIRGSINGPEGKIFDVTS
jgi:catechol 2,3-dioxygenase-like lactoylglutathione lyase family enzyme